MALHTQRDIVSEIHQRISQVGVFAHQQPTKDGLICQARHVQSEAYYYVNIEQGTAWVGLYTPDRWLSESIEADLMHLGDKLEELLEDELIDQGYETSLPVEHFRDQQKHYVFRSPVSITPSDSIDQQQITDRVMQVLLAYEATFSQLGDMSPKDDTL